MKFADIRKHLVSLMMLLGSSFFFLAHAQTGPGGVGDATSNILWLQSDKISGLNNSDDVTTWVDSSGNSNDLSQPNASFKPVFQTGILNNYPVVRFNKANGRLRRTGFATFPTTTITAIYVNRNTESNDATLSYASSATANDFLLFGSDNLNIYRSSNIASGVAFNDNSFHIATVGWQSTGGEVEVWKDGTQSYTTTGHQSGTSITTGGCLAIAGEQDAIDGNYEVTQAHFGDFSEIIIYNTDLNTAQHIIVSNYLATKYGLTISNDRYTYDATYPHDVAGIGREDASNTHTAAMSANLLQIQNASDLNVNQEYLLFGHDSASTTSWTTTEVPNSGVNIQRLAREWRLDETGDVGTVDFEIDVANLAAFPAGYSMYGLMVDADGDFSSGASVYEMTLVAGTRYTTTGINISDGDFVSIAVLEPHIEHTTTTSSGFETGNASIQISLNFIPENNITVDYTTADGTALSAQPDYTAVIAGTATILAGNTTANYTISVTNDIIVENSETFSVTLSNPSAGINLGTNTTHTYTILDDDDSRKVYFDLASANGDESVLLVSVMLSINNIDLINPTTVDYAVTGGTAVGGGVDFTLAAGTVTFPASTTTGSFTFTVNDDAIYESNETLIITLSNPTNCNVDGAIPLGGTGFFTYTYTVNNNDTPPVMQFNATSSSGSEATSLVNFQLDLNVASEVDAMATYTATGTATGGGADYTLANGTVTIVAGNTTLNLTAVVTNDLLEEVMETIIITLSLPVDATLGINTVHTYGIIDDDQFGYLGPGGVGQASNNKLWVKSDDLTVVADATNITSWSDASGNGNDLSQSNTSFTPRYYNNVLNGRPVVRLEQSNSRIIHNSYADFPTTAITTMVVNRNSDSGDGMLSYASSASDNEYLLFNSSSLQIFRGGSNVNSGTALNGNTWRIIGNTWESSAGSTILYTNGTQSYSGTLASGTSMTQGGNFALGGEQDAVDGGYSASQAHQGDFAEVIIYDVVLNSAQRKIVDNYLSAKYNITISNDMFSYDAPGNYEHEVAGIGRDNVTNFHIDAQGSAIVRINSAADLGDGEYLVWGHDSAGFATANTVDKPLGVNNRMEQIWRVDETGDVGTVSVQVDLNNFTVGNSNDLVLLIDSDDGVFINASSTAISSFAGGIATFNNVNFATGNWFTVGSTTAANPLPINLLYFDAAVMGDQVKLIWETASEINNDYFTIERTQQGTNWESVLQVEGAGNSSSSQKYTVVDKHPISGTSYYRLRQTDYDGTQTYSDVVAVNFTTENKRKNIFIYPNPWNQASPATVRLEGFSGKVVSLNLIDMKGELLYSQRIDIKENRTQFTIDIDKKLLPGLYLISVRTADSSTNQRLIIKW
jgi:hypothetical protein